MADLTQAKASLFNAKRQVYKGADLTLVFLKYTNTAKFAVLTATPIEENFNVENTFQSRISEGRQVGGESETLQFADLDGTLFTICRNATGCVFDAMIYKLSIKSRPRRYTNDETDFQRVWEWFMSDTGVDYVAPVVVPVGDFFVVTCGVAELIGGYVNMGDHNGRPYYTLNGAAGNPWLDEVSGFYWGTTTWGFTLVGVGTQYFSMNDVGTPLEVTLWEVLGGTMPTPMLEAA